MPVPANDNFANATEITIPVGSDTTVTTAELATTESGEPAPTCYGRTIPHSCWWKFTALRDGTATFDTHGSQTHSSGVLDTGMAAFYGADLASLVEIACNDDSTDLTSEITFPITTGVTYYVLAGLFDESYSGSITLNWSTDTLGPPPPIPYWSQVTTPADGDQINGFVKTNSGRIVACLRSSGVGNAIIVSDDDGATWSYKPSTFDPGYGQGIAYSSSLDRIVVVGMDNSVVNEIMYSDDNGETWIGAGNPVGATASFGSSVARDEDEGLFVAAFPFAANIIVTSPDGITWTVQSTPWDGGSATVYGICRAKGTINLWVAVGFGPDGTKTGMTSPDGITWTEMVSGPFEGASGIGWGIAWSDSQALLVCVSSAISSGAVISKSVDAVTWSSRSSPLDGYPAYAVAISANDIFVGGEKGIVESGDSGDTWITDTGFKFTSTGGPGTVYGCFSLFFVSSTRALAGGIDEAGTVSLEVADPVSPPSPITDFTFSVGGSGVDTGDLPGVYYIDHLDHDTTTRLQTFRPENLNFELNIRNPDTVDYEISLGAKDINGDPVVSSHDFIGAWRTCWRFRCGDVVITAGPHSMVNGSYGQDYMKVSGVSWLGYLNRRFFPFDPRHTPNYATTHVNDYVIGSAPQGLAYEVQNVDASIIVNAIWQAIFSRPNSMPLSYDVASLGVNVPHFSLALGDTTMFLSNLQTLSEYDPGFDYWVAPVTKKLRLASPYRFGTPAAIVAGGATGTGIKEIFTNDVTLLAEPNATDMLSLDFTNTGPEGTHIFGIGAGLGGNQLGIALGLSTNEGAFWRLDVDYEAGDVKNYQMLEAMTRKQFALGLQPVHEIPIVVDPGYIPDFWTNVRAGVAVWVKLDLGFHQIDSPQRITRMSGSLGNEGNVQVTLDHDQIYDVDPSVGDYEG